MLLWSEAIWKALMWITRMDNFINRIVNSEVIQISCYILNGSDHDCPASDLGM
jgi:hypothetical protein